MSLKETIKENYQLELPIAGGDGSSVKEAIVIKTDFYPPQDVQQAVLKHYFALMSCPWKMLMQQLVYKDNKPMDVLKVAYLKNNETYVSDWYFDLSHCEISHDKPEK